MRKKAKVSVKFCVKPVKEIKMNCKSVNKKLIFYIDNETSKSEHEEIQAHLKSCKKCSALYYELKTTLKLIGERKTPEPNPFLYTRIKQELERRKSREKFYNFSLNRVLQPVFLSFLLILGVAGGIKLGSMYETKQNNQNVISQTTEFYLNDFEQEKIEAFLLNN